MILFVASWRAAEPTRARAAAALFAHAATFTELSSAELKQTAWPTDVHVAWIGESRVGADVAATPERVSIVEGVCLDGPRAMTAATLRITDELDGQFALVDATGQRLDVATDMLGLCPLYWCRDGDAYLISNRVEMLARTLGTRGIDLDAAGCSLSIGWATGEQTLVPGVRAMPGGARWSFAKTSSLDTRPAGLARLRRNPSTPALAKALTAGCEAVGAWAGTVEAPLTAGLDSRVVFALLRTAGVEACYVTEGAEDSEDVVRARQLAALTHVDHEVFPTSQVTSRWQELASQLVVQNDGMVSLWQVANLSRPQVSLPLTLWGMGGEIGRGFYTRPEDLLPGRVCGSVQRFVEQRAGRAHGLVSAQARGVARDQMQGIVDRSLASGFRPADVRDAFYAFERVGRWAGANARRARTPLFAPLATRPFIEAAFSLSPATRWCEPLHYRLLKYLAPDLHAFPVSKGWRPQRPRINVARAAVARLTHKNQPAVASRMPQLAMFDAVRADLAARCLDRSSSPLWEVVNRDVFESLMTGGKTDAAMPLLQVVTLFEYEEFRARQAREA